MDGSHCIEFFVLSCKCAYSAYSSLDFFSEAGQSTGITDNRKRQRLAQENSIAIAGIHKEYKDD
jgi:hypothetical protein